MWTPSVKKGGASWRSVPGASPWPPVCEEGFVVVGIKKRLRTFKLSCHIRFKPYLHPLGQQLGVLGGLLLVLLGALPLQGNAAALVLQHTRGHQSLDPRSFGSWLLA